MFRGSILKLRSYNVAKSFSSSTPLQSSSSSLCNSEKNPGKVVFISQSTDVFSNLALEDWFYKNWKFEKRNLLFLWRNQPCVVIGRHQNPFLEANVPYLQSAGVPVARRNSGGGTVYHDEGNLNCTFFTPRSRYNRHKNLEIICDVLTDDFNVSAEVNKKDDIVVEGCKKISGTAAKLGRLSAYHHCTLLVSTDKLQLKLALAGDKTLESNATNSIPSPTANLIDLYSQLSVDSLITSIGHKYLKKDSENCWSDGFALVNPTDEWFPGLDELRSKLQSWEWLHGMTPLFKITRPVALDPTLCEGSSVLVKVEAFHGQIKAITAVGHIGKKLGNMLENIEESMQGIHYEPDVFGIIESKLLGSDIKRSASTN